MDNKPEYIRLPASGKKCPWTSLGRSTLTELILPTKNNGGKPPVKSRLLKTKATNMSGVRLIHLGSLLQFLDGAEEKVEGGAS